LKNGCFQLVHCGFPAVTDLKLLQKVVYVVFDRLKLQIQVEADFFIGHAILDDVKHFPFPLRKVA
jgi:hypothetical protein